MKWIISLTVFSAAVLLLLSASSEAQSPALPASKSAPAANSGWEFLAEVKGFNFRCVTDSRKCVKGSVVTGSTTTEGMVDVKVYRGQHSCLVDLNISAQLRSTSVAVRPKIEAHSHCLGQVTARRSFIFDGKSFSATPSTVKVSLHSYLDSLSPAHKGVVGAVVVRVATPRAKRDLSLADQLAEQQIRAEVTRVFDEASDDFVHTSNHVLDALRKAGILPLHRKVPGGTGPVPDTKDPTPLPAR